MRSAVITLGVLVLIGCDGVSADGAPDVEEPGDVPLPESNQAAIHAQLHPKVFPKPKCEGAAGWQINNDGLSGGAVHDAVFDSRQEGLAWTTTPSGIYQSSDGGVTWNRRSEQNGIFRLAVPAADSTSILYGASQSGVVMSVDGGMSWDSVGLSGLTISALLVHPQSSLRMYATVHGGGIYRSDDGGETWRAVNLGIPHSDIVDISADPNDLDALAIAAIPIGEHGYETAGVLLRSKDAGNSWEKVLEVGSATRGIARCSTNAKLMYATSEYSGLYRTIDNGDTWENIGLAGGVLSDVDLSADCATVYVSSYGNGVHVSTNNGASFSPALSVGIPFEKKGPERISVDAFDGSNMLGAGLAGAVLTEDMAQTFNLLDLPNHVALSVRGVSGTQNEGEIWLSTFGNGLWHRPSDTTPWSRVELDRDYTFTVAVDPANASHVVVGGWPEVFVTNDAATFNQTTTGQYNPLSFSFGIDGAMYMGTQVHGIFRSDDGGQNWSPISGNLVPWNTLEGGYKSSSVHADVEDADVVYLGTEASGLYKTADSGGTWTLLADFSHAVTCVVQPKFDPARLYVCEQGAGLWASYDAGATWELFVDGLESLEVAGLVVDEVSETLYLSAAPGVYSSKNGQPWVRFDAATMPTDVPGPLAIIASGSERRLVMGSNTLGTIQHALP